MGSEAGAGIVYTGKVKLEACSACQLRCPSCPTTTGDTAAVVGKSYLRANDFITLIDENPWIGCLELSNYGEVFLNPELLDIFRHAYERNVKLLIANGANLNHVRVDVLEGLVRYRVARLTCSIDGASQERYERYRVRGRLDRVIANIRHINRFKTSHGVQSPVLVWQFVAFGHNEEEIPAARKLAEELGMEFHVKLSWDSDFSPVKDKEMIRQVTGGPAATRAEHLELTGTDYMEGICADLWQEPQVNWNGAILGCCRNFWGDFGGHAFRDGLIEGLNHEKMRYARAMLSGEAEPRADIPCTTCSIYAVRRASSRWINPTALRPDWAAASDATAKPWEEAISSRRQGNLDQAAAWARVVLQLVPHHPGALGILRDLSARDGRIEATRYYRRKAAAAARNRSRRRRQP